MSWSSSRDNWERLVAAVVKKEQIWQLCHQDSISTVASDFSQEILRFSSNSLRPFSSSPSPQLPLTNNSVLEARKNASGGIKQKLFSALLRRRKPKDYDLGQGLVGIPEDHFGLESFSLHELRAATDNFHKRNVIGYKSRDGNGTAYKGRLADGSLVAVQRLREDKNWLEYLEMANQVDHRNLCRLRGFCIMQKELLLVYPYMANGNVASWLRDRYETQPPLKWPVRKSIAVGVARGLAHLHHGCIKVIIHRDIIAAHILLNEEFEAVIVNFFWAKFMEDGNDYDVVRGTSGLIAPEYISSGKCTEKIDVFGYGIFLLELISGQRAFDLARLANDEDLTLLDWVKNLYEAKEMELIVDPNLEGNFVDEEVEKLLHLAFMCIHNDPEERLSMFEAVRILEDRDGMAETGRMYKNDDFGNEHSSSQGTSLAILTLNFGFFMFH